jgi:MFS family permease
VVQKAKDGLGAAFNRLFSAFALVKLSDGLIAAASPLLALQLTRDPFLIALTGALYMLPWLLFAIPVGTLLDRIDRRVALSVTAMVRASVASLLCAAIFFDFINIGLLYFVIFVVGICDVVSDTGLQSLIPTVLPHSKLERGNSRKQAADTVLNGFIGTPLGSVLFSLMAALPFLFNSVGFFVAALVIATIPRDMIAVSVLAKKERPAFVSEMKAGIKYLINDKKLLRLVLTTAAMGMCFTLSNATQALFLVEELGVAEAAFGSVLLAGGVGAVAGALFASRVSKRWGRGTALATGITITTFFDLLQGFVPDVFAFMAAMVVAGFGVSLWNILLMSLYHTLIPNEIFGRIHGTRRTLVWGLMPIGALIGGNLAKIDLRMPYFVGGTIATLIAIFSFRFIKALGDESDKPDEPAKQTEASS